MNIEKVRIQAEKLYPEFMKALETITGFERGSKNVSGLRQMAEFLKKELEELGCTITIHENETYGPTLVARKKGTGKVKLMFFAHMDTVWEPGTCQIRKFEIRGNSAYGPGVSDCSHGMLGQLFMLKILTALKFNQFGEIILLFNPDEEVGSTSSKQWIKKYAKEADVAICMEGPDHENEFIAARGGSMYFEMRVKGVSAHAGCAPEKGRNAIAELCYKLNMIQQLEIPEAIQCLTKLEGGSGDCSVADNAMAHFRFRVDSFEAMDRVHKAMDKIGKMCFIDGTETELTYLADEEFPPMVKYPQAQEYIELVEETSREMGMPLKAVFCGGASDGAFACQTGTVTLDGLTPISYGWHTPDEHLELQTIVPRLTLLATVVSRISERSR